jgi:hypothetical protein
MIDWKGACKLFLALLKTMVAHILEKNKKGNDKNAQRLFDNICYYLSIRYRNVNNTRLSDWARQHGKELGTRYANELARRQNRQQAYEHL